MKSLSDLKQGEVERFLDIVDRLNDIEVHLEVGDMKLHVRKFGDATLASAGLASAFGSSQPAAQPPAAAARSQPASSAPSPAAPAKTATAPAASQPGLVEVRAPMLGRFYRAASPGDPAYVEAGSKVGAEDTVCMIEVMKLFNTVPAGVAGTIIEIVAENGSMVEHDAVLFRVRPE